MLNILNINLKTDIKNNRATALGIKLMSQDKNNSQFILRFTNGNEPVNLDNTYTVEVLSKFEKSQVSRLTSATIYRDYARWNFDTNYITQDEKVTNYVYVRKSGTLETSADANAFAFDVGLSEIDKDAGRVAEVYDDNYQKYLDEFKDNVDFEEIAQAEQARKEAELLREENYNQKVDTAIVEADVVAKVDNKVTELTPQINDLTAQLAETNEQFNQAVGAVTEDSEVVLARSEYPTLKERLDAEWDNVNAQLAEKANKEQEAWITPTLLNGWAEVSGYPVAYRKNQLGKVEFKGRVTGAGGVATIFTLPTGYKPLVTTTGFISGGGGGGVGINTFRIEAQMSPGNVYPREYTTGVGLDLTQFTFSTT